MTQTRHSTKEEEERWDREKAAALEAARESARERKAAEIIESTKKAMMLLEQTRLEASKQSPRMPPQSLLKDDELVCKVVAAVAEMERQAESSRKILTISPDSEPTTNSNALAPKNPPHQIPVEEWDVEDVCDWLKKIKIPDQFIEKFRSEYITGNILFDLSANDLAAMKLPLGIIKSFQKSVQLLQQSQ